jgi:hypothetical protein
MTRIAFKVAALMFGCLLFAQPALASYLRCGTHLIQAGGRSAPGMYEVLMKCGAPAERFGTTWIYKRGGSTRVVHFNDAGRLARIEARDDR